MRSNMMESAISLLGGAGLGALAMYLFDPEMGERRRSEVTHTADRAMGATGEAVHATLHGANDTAHSIAAHISDYAKHLSEHLHAGSTSAASAGATMAQRAAQMASGAADLTRQHVGDVARTAQDYLSHARERTQAVREAAMGESHSGVCATGITAGAIGLLVLGAGAMYFMDPNRGRARRAWIEQKAMRATVRTGKRARGLGRHVGNKLQGYVHDARGAIPENWRTGSGQASMPSAPPAFQQ